jgi:hypothetical protein
MPLRFHREIDRNQDPPVVSPSNCLKGSTMVVKSGHLRSKIPRGGLVISVGRRNTLFNSPAVAMTRTTNWWVCT